LTCHFVSQATDSPWIYLKFPTHNFEYQNRQEFWTNLWWIRKLAIFCRVVIPLGYRWKIGYIWAFYWPNLIPRPDLKTILFYYEFQNTKIWFENNLVACDGLEVEVRWKISDLGRVPNLFYFIQPSFVFIKPINQMSFIFEIMMKSFEFINYP
jgi:hypothetical protein